MIWFDLAVAAYVAVALFALHMTMVEAEAKGQRALADRVLGCLACTVWPLTVLTVAIWCLAHRPSRRQADRPRVGLR